MTETSAAGRAESNLGWATAGTMKMTPARIASPTELKKRMIKVLVRSQTTRLMALVPQRSETKTRADSVFPIDPILAARLIIMSIIVLIANSAMIGTVFSPTFEALIVSTLVLVGQPVVVPFVRVAFIAM